MGSINQVLGDAGAGHTITLAGRQITLKPMTKRRQAGFEDWLEERAITTAIRTAGRLRKRSRELWARFRELQNESSDKATDRLREIEIEIKDVEAEARALTREADGQTDKASDKIAAGHYGYLGDVAQNSLSTFDGSVTLIHQMTQPHHPEITRDQVAEWYADDDLRIALNNAVRKAEGLERPTAAQEGQNESQTTKTIAKPAA